MSKFTPWTRKQAEQWAEEHTESKSLSEAWYVMEVMHASFLAGLAKAAEMIEASPTVWGSVGEYGSTFSTYPPGTFIQENNTHQAKLVCPQPIDEEPSNDQ